MLDINEVYMLTLDAEWFASISHSFEAGIANTISSFE